MIIDYKITDAEIQANNVKSVSGDKLTGTVSENKNVFDKLPEFIAARFNSLIDSIKDLKAVALTGESADLNDGNTLAHLNSPVFEGTPTAPTPTQGDNSDKIATTKFVSQVAIAAGAGDMTKSVYDTDGDGKVNTAAAADRVGSYTESDISAIETAVSGKQSALGFTPVQQGGGTSMNSNKIYIGWDNSDKILAQVDNVPQGYILTSNKMDTTPRSGSSNVITSGALYSAVNARYVYDATVFLDPYVLHKDSAIIREFTPNAGRVVIYPYLGLVTILSTVEITHAQDSGAGVFTIGTINSTFNSYKPIWYTVAPVWEGNTNRIDAVRVTPEGMIEARFNNLSASSEGATFRFSCTYNYL